MQVTADFKVYNVYLDEYGEEQRKYVGDIRDVQSISVKDFGGLSAERLQQISKGRFDGTMTVFPDEKKEVPMPPNAPRYLNKVSSWHLGSTWVTCPLQDICRDTWLRKVVYIQDGIQQLAVVN